LLVGTRGCEIYEIDAEDQPKVYMHGHFNGEVWGAAVHPNEPIFVSCGGDKTLWKWNTTKMIKASEPFECDIKAIDWSSDGKHIVVGGDAGNLFSVNADSFDIISKV